ncbi:MAG TPA: hypothetical protein VFP59_03925 [Candidatus Angelobacter sp.]|nr:hypothetical protein [Candidatus Angelobacter sp.]
MSRHKRFIPGILAMAVAATLLPAAAYQGPPRSMPQQEGPPRSMPQREKEMLKAANKKREEDIRKDTDKLFQLASELKAAVDKTNENVLSLDVIRKADEVEKLAKQVKEKMKQNIGPNPRLEPLPMPVGPVPRPPQ